MKVEKKLLRDALINQLFEIKMIYEDGHEYAIRSVVYKENNNVSYNLWQAQNTDDVLFGYKDIISSIENKYKKTLLPMYFEDSNMSICEFSIDEYGFKLFCDYDSNIISILKQKGENESSFSDDFVVYLTQNLLESMAKRNSLGSGR